MLRGIRGAITVENNNADEIKAVTRKLLEEMAKANSVKAEDIASIIFSVTRDLDAVFPAEAAREIGWKYVPLLCTYEISVPGSLAKCIRVLIQVNTDKTQKEIKHLYLAEAKKLREDF